MSNTANTERVHVAIPPMPSIDTRLLKAMSKITGQVGYDLKLKLKGSLPRSIMVCPTLSQAEAVADRLRDLGLTTIVYRQDDLPPQVPFAVHKLGLKGSTLKIADRRGNVRTIAAADVAMMVYGRREIHSTHAELKCERKINFGYAMLGHGPATSLHADVEDVHDVAREHFLVLFPRDVGEMPLEFPGGGVDYRCLGRNIRRTKPENHKLLVLQLRALFADAAFDDRLATQPCGDGSGEAFFNRKLSEDSSWACATLIYWEMLAERSEPKHFNGSTRGGAD